MYRSMVQRHSQTIHGSNEVVVGVRRSTNLPGIHLTGACRSRVAEHWAPTREDPKILHTR